MPEHYILATTEASIWCTKCNKMTMWRIAQRRRQYCLECYAKPRPEKKEKPAPPLKERGLFDA